MNLALRDIRHHLGRFLLTALGLGLLQEGLPALLDQLIEVRVLGPASLVAVLAAGALTEDATH